MPEGSWVGYAISLEGVPQIDDDVKEEIARCAEWHKPLPKWAQRSANLAIEQATAEIRRRYEERMGSRRIEEAEIYETDDECCDQEYCR